MFDRTTVGVDLAKQVFSVCVVDARGKVIGRHELRRDSLSRFLQQLAPGTVVAMEACSSAHYWGRLSLSYGLVPRLMAAQFVQSFRKSIAVKNDRNDAEAIATAARQGNMRFVPLKSEAQQARLSWHRAREGYKKENLAIMNRIRGLLAEFGVVINRSAVALSRTLARLDEYTLPGTLVTLIRQLQQHWHVIQTAMKDCEKQIKQHADEDERCARLRKLTGVGPLSADAIVATIGNGNEFANGRQCAAWMGLTPRQHGTGGKVVLGNITCRGDTYLRTLLIQGARSSVQQARITALEKLSYEQQWILQLSTRLPFGKVVVAVANKHARQIWAMLARQEHYDADAWRQHPMHITA